MTTERIHSLDALRAIMMLLGIVLHSAETYSVGVDLLWPKDPHSTSYFFTYLTSVIHIFRMPIFFLLSGFFAAMLYYDRSPAAMISQRFKRILLPFIVFLLILHPIIYHSYDFMIKSFGLDNFPNVLFRWLPNITYHLWFLYYLIIITSVAVLIASFLKSTKKVKSFILNSFNRLFQRQLGFILILSVILFFLLVWMWDYWAPTPLVFVPDVKVMVFYCVFYFFGWVLYKAKDKINLFMNYDWAFVIIAFITYTIKFIYSDQIDDVIYGALNTIIGWFFIFGIIGLFLRYFNGPSKFRRYLSDSSYWVYLIHLPFTLIVPALIVNWSIPTGLKFIIVMTGTTVICYATYHFLVRGTFISKFLNGRTYK
ncbi:acyltransferase family protein [Ekhidna sp.]|uniref:acyltransferase family protein n=1 Tax=Ekhidna sp. TaxID=2608089 RepID=UPI00329A24CE